MVTLENIRSLNNSAFEVLKAIRNLMVQTNLNEYRHTEIERAGLDERRIAPYDASILESAHAPQARRRGQSDAAREHDIGKTCVSLQLLNDPTVDLIQPT